MTPVERERGATLVLVAASLLLLIGVVAIVVDLAAVRLDLRTDRLAADAASTAGVLAIDPFAGTGVDEGCNTAWNYALLNLDGVDPSTPAPTQCATAFTTACDSAVARTATGVVGPYTVEITHPVPDAHDFMGGQAINATIDGVPCQRFAVAITRDRQHAFAQVMGFDSTATRVVSVARLDPDAGGGEVVPLLVLEPINCALVTKGQAKVTVSYDVVTQTPGFIVVDSDASACQPPDGAYSIDAEGNQNGWIRAIPVPVTNIPSAILSYALSGIPPANSAKSFDPSDLTSPVDPADADQGDSAESLFRLYPEPIAVSRRITRAPIDWRYNCKASYDPYPFVLSDPSQGHVFVPGCPQSPAPHIDDHVTAYGAGTPTGTWNNWISAGYLCTVDAPLTLSGNWFIDCPGGLIVNGTALEFTDGDLVLTGGIDLRSTASLKINQGSGKDHFVFVRKEGSNGTILKNAQSTLVLERTFVYLADGAVDLRGGDGGLTWTAPVSGTWEDLALWSEGRIPHEIGGQAGNTLTGTFFTPYAEPFSLTGQGGQFQTEAQFITRRLEVKGQGEVKMKPDPDSSTLIPIRAVRLIR